MRHASLLMLLIALFNVHPALASVGVMPARQETATPNVLLSSPMGGQALQGVVAIRGNTAVASFQSASLAFSYSGDATGTWFLIIESEAPVAYDIIAQWDTTTITDGNYDLHLSVRLTDGSQFSVTVEGLRVRNYSAVEADTATPPAPSATPSPPTQGETIESTQAAPTLTATTTTTATVTPNPPTITPLPPNPAELSQADIVNTFSKGGAAALALFALLGVYLAGRAVLRRPRKPREN
jgi:hypothetical protein